MTLARLRISGHCKGHCSRDYVNENTRTYFDEKDKWYYWQSLQVDDLVAFIQEDSHIGDIE